MSSLGSEARGRLAVGCPVAIIDIGSNSVRLVAYEGLTRAPTPIYNEKVLCGLGRHVLTTGRLDDEAVERALRALARFRILCDTMGVEALFVLATAAARDASNGPAFLDAAAEAVRDYDVSAETFDERPKLSTRRADALSILAESFLAHGAQSLSGGERHQIVVHVDAETLRAGTAGRCELEEGPSMPAETVRRLACDASVIAILEDRDGAALDVGRKTRSIPPAIRRALKARDRGCRFPGCPNTHYVDGHHVRHWADGGETRLGNLLTLCRFHHRQVHEGCVEIRILDDGAVRFLRPDGRSFDGVAPGRVRPLGDWTQLVATDRMLGIHIDASTAATRWRGETMDYGLAIETLLHRAQRSRDVSAETPAIVPGEADQARIGPHNAQLQATD